MSLYISEIFYSVQGEGPNLGLPAIFLRLAGCNLACGFCDSKYSWQNGENLTIAEIITKVNSYNCRRVVVTGGEPLLQQENLAELLSILKDDLTGFIDFIEVETNGSISPSKQMLKVVDSWIVSPKLFPISIETFSFLKPKIVNKLHLKFVIQDSDDFDIIEKQYTQIDHLIAPEAIILMPMTPIDRPEPLTLQAMKSFQEEDQKLLQDIIEFAKLHGFRVTPRLQVIAHGSNKRGV